MSFFLIIAFFIDDSVCHLLTYDKTYCYVTALNVYGIIIQDANTCLTN